MWKGGTLLSYSWDLWSQSTYSQTDNQITHLQQKLVIIYTLKNLTENKKWQDNATFNKSTKSRLWLLMYILIPDSIMWTSSWYMQHKCELQSLFSLKTKMKEIFQQWKYVENISSASPFPKQQLPAKTWCINQKASFSNKLCPPSS